MADLMPNSAASATPVERESRSLHRRLEPALVKQIVAEYEAGVTTPNLCNTYGLSKTGILRLIRDEGVALRRQPLTVDQVDVARKLYEHGHPIAAIATRLNTSYNNVRHDCSRKVCGFAPVAAPTGDPWHYRDTFLLLKSRLS